MTGSVASHGQLFDRPEDLSQEWSEALLARAGIRLERIVSLGHASPEGFWYDQAEDEWVALLSGAAELTLLDPHEIRRLQPGEWLFIPAHRRHRVSWTATGTASVWLALFLPPSSPSLPESRVQDSAEESPSPP